MSMVYGQPAHSNTSLDGVSPRTYALSPAYDGVALLARTPSRPLRVYPNTPSSPCKLSTSTPTRESVPVRGPGVPLASWMLPVSDDLTSLRFLVLSTILELGIFYLVQAVQFAAGVALLHALYPTQPDYAMTTARSLRIGAAGGAMYLAFVALRSSLELVCPSPAGEEEEDEEGRQPECWHSVGDAVGYLARSAPDVRCAALMGVVGSAAFGRMYDGSGLLYAATAALTGYFVLLVPKAALMYSCSELALEKERLRAGAQAGVGLRKQL